MSSVVRRRSPFGLSIGSICASFIIIGGVQVLIAGLRAPLSIGAVDLINWIGKVSHTLTPLRAGAPIQWSGVFENIVLSAIFVAAGLGIGSWLRGDPR
jgi:hypothetical protein